MADEQRKYLDDTGVSLLWGKIKSGFVAQGDDKNTTYELSQNATDGHKITLKGTLDGKQVYSKDVTIPDNDTTYTFAEGTVDGKFSVTPSGGTAQAIPIHGLKSAAFTESSDYATATHTQPSSSITAMTGYAKGDSTSAISTSDTLNQAIGKLEKALDSKADSGDVFSGDYTDLTNKPSAMGQSEATAGTATAARLITAKVLNDTIVGKGYTSNVGTITGVQTSAGAHTAINVSSGKASFSVPTKTSHLTNDSGFLTDADLPTIDNALSDSSENAVQNKVVKGALDLKANLASPTFTGTPKAPTAAKTTNTTQIATTAFVKTVVGDYAPKANPNLTGTPTAPTATAGTNTTQIATTAFVKVAVDNAIGTITGISFVKVNSYADLPATGSSGAIYLVPNSGTNPNIYDEYVWIAVDNNYEKIGTTEVDLSDYMKKTDMRAITSAELDAICV